MSHPAGMQNYHVAYPSGTHFHCRGQFAVLRLPGAGQVPTITRGQHVHVCDPRAVIRVGGRVVYEPRAARAQLMPEMRAWLAAHPEWPSALLGPAEA